MRTARPTPRHHRHEQQPHRTDTHTHLTPPSQHPTEDRRSPTPPHPAQIRRAGNLTGAHDRFEVTGVGESFFTKWVWTATLSGPPTARALILDQRLRWSKWKLQPGERRAPLGSAGYAGFVHAAHQIADRLEASEFGHIDAEKIECLLFDRARIQSDRVDLHARLVAHEPGDA